MKSTTLIVDLDKTLIKTDFLYESFINYCSRNLFAPLICFLILLRKGKIELKKFLCSHTDIKVENLPYNNKVLNFINEWKKEVNGDVFLVSASHEMIVEKVADFLNCFTGWYGSNSVNLKSNNKLKKIKELTKDGAYTYIGDSYDDLVIWEDANTVVLVNPSSGLEKKVSDLKKPTEIIKNKKNLFIEIFKTLRIYQWVKNGLLFVPTILALQPVQLISINLISGFLSFSFIASAFYILNDLFDIESDRNHHLKKKRSFASGALSIPSGIAVMFIMLVFAFVVAIDLPIYFQYCLVIYALSTFLYSKYLKQLPIIDILTLSYLYLLRIISGGILASISMSNWLLTFSVFFFLFLAAVKRWIEIRKTNAKSIHGRGYEMNDIQFVSQISYFSGLISVLIICLYIESQQAQALYDSSKILWFIPIILLYWILETLFKVERDIVDDDPVKYAIKSKTSYIALISFIIILFLTSIL